jgi:hypothetical protein
MIVSTRVKDIIMSVKDGRNVKTRGWTRKHKRAYTKNAKYKDRPDNYFHKS